jgi:hypothetical protein
VELDGSADFTNIQPAVEAAASGDTVLIGPGRFDQYFMYQAPGWSDWAVVGFGNKDLTFIGSGQGITVIGPESSTSKIYPGPIGIANIGDDSVSIEDLTIENTRLGIYFWSAALHVNNCMIRNHIGGIHAWATTFATITNCRFEHCDDSIVGFSRTTRMIVADCEFYGPTMWLHIAAQGVEDVLVERCQFHDARGAFQIDGVNCIGIMRDCIVHVSYGTPGGPIAAISGAHLTIVDNELFGGEKQLMVSSATVVGSGNIFHGTDYPGGGYATIYGAMGVVDLHDNHIFMGDAHHVVRLDYYIQPELIELDLRNNWWGTTDADTLAAWCLDEHDDPTLNVRTLYDPYHNGPVGNEDMSFGEVKAMYRR